MGTAWDLQERRADCVRILQTELQHITRRSCADESVAQVQRLDTISNAIATMIERPVPSPHGAKSHDLTHLSPPRL